MSKQMCQALCEQPARYKIKAWHECQNTATMEINGMHLCGTHINALAKSGISLRRFIDSTEDF